MNSSPDNQTGPTRHGKPEQGYVQQGLLLPETMRARFREHINPLGTGAVKIAGTTAMGIYLGMPQKLREWLYLWSLQQSWEGPDALAPEAIFEQFIAFYAHSKEKRAPIVGSVGELPSHTPNVTHYVDRIIDPSAKGVKPPKKTGSGD